MIEPSEEGQIDNVEPTVSEAADLETLKQALAGEKTKAEEYLANWQRTQADFVNFKRRAEQEKEEIGKFANATLMLSILPSLDDLERAFAAIPARMAKASWVDGIRLIERKIFTSLEAQGLSPIKALGKPFDPNLHEALMHTKGQEGIVIQEAQKGYKLHDRVIRPTKVLVGNGEEEI
ncbi:nucleotide exchange factor GrpE [Chloroflexota bacterium]